MAVPGVLATLGLVAWLLLPDGNAPMPPAAAPVEAPTADSAPVLPADPRTSRQPGSAKPDNGIPQIATREELLAVLKARGLDAEKLLAGYRSWRIDRGFLGADPLAGVTVDNAPGQIYAAMDRSALKSLADTGDVGAMQAYAAANLPDDPFTAIDYLRRASERGSAAAAAEIAGILATLGEAAPGSLSGDPSFADRLLRLRGGDPGRDLREDAVAWTLASIRQYGPALATPGNLGLVEQLGLGADEGRLLRICGRSLAILAELSAATAGQDNNALPPVFVAERDLYGRLPCRETPVPVTPPRALAACTSSTARGADNRVVELWICPGG